MKQSREENLAHQKIWREKNRDKLKVSKKIYFQQNRKKCYATVKLWREKNPEKKHMIDVRRRERRFGVSYPTWWLCDVCSKPISGSDIQLDHNHLTGKFRSWLCKDCNHKEGVIRSCIK